MINNFVKNVCECVGDWKMDAFVENTIKEIREKSETAEYCLHYQAELILQWQQDYFPERSESSLPAYS